MVLALPRKPPCLGEGVGRGRRHHAERLCTNSPGCLARVGAWHRGKAVPRCGLKRPPPLCLPDLPDCTVKPCTKQLHLTLAHKFYPHHQRTLEELARAIYPGHSCQWTAAIYSRDMRFVHYQVSKPRPGGLGQSSLGRAVLSG